MKNHTPVSEVRIGIWKAAFAIAGVLGAGFPSAGAYDRDHGDRSKTYSVKTVVAPYGNRGTAPDWHQSVENRPIEGVSAYLRREHGSRETVCTAGFEGRTPFHPNPVQIDQNSLHEVQWDARGEEGRGRPLRLSCTGGNVYVDSVTVHYASGGRYHPDDDHDHYDDRRPGSGLSERGREEIAKLAHELEEQSEQAYVEIRNATGRYRGSSVVASAQHFRDQARQFHDRVESYETTPWEIDRDARHLAQDARSVQAEMRRTGLRDEEALEQWEDVAIILDRIADSFVANRRPGRNVGRIHSIPHR